MQRLAFFSQFLYKFNHPSGVPCGASFKSGALGTVCPPVEHILLIALDSFGIHCREVVLLVAVGHKIEQVYLVVLAPHTFPVTVGDGHESRLGRIEFALWHGQVLLKSWKHRHTVNLAGIVNVTHVEESGHEVDAVHRF